MEEAPDVTAGVPMHSVAFFRESVVEFLESHIVLSSRSDDETFATGYHGISNDKRTSPTPDVIEVPTGALDDSSLSQPTKPPTQESSIISACVHLKIPVAVRQFRRRPHLDALALAASTEKEFYGDSSHFDGSQTSHMQHNPVSS